MPFHICADEIIAFMMLFPFVGMFIRTYRDKIHGWFHKAKGVKGLKRECPHDHEGHYRDAANRQSQPSWWSRLFSKMGSWTLGRFSLTRNSVDKLEVIVSDDGSLEVVQKDES